MISKASRISWAAVACMLPFWIVEGAAAVEPEASNAPPDPAVFVQPKSIEVANALIGNWIGLSYSRNGQPFKPIPPKLATLSLPSRQSHSFRVFSGRESGRSFPSPEWSVDATKTPMEFFIARVNRTAVFQLDGDKLTWCQVGSDDRPPFSLVTKEGDGYHVVVRFIRAGKHLPDAKAWALDGDKQPAEGSKRPGKTSDRAGPEQKPVSPTTAPESPDASAVFNQERSREAADALIGLWAGGSYSQNGEPLQPLGPKAARLKLPNRHFYAYDFVGANPTAGNRTGLIEVHAGTRPPSLWVVDGTKTPMQFLFITGEGKDRSSQIHAVFELEGDNLTWRLVDFEERPPFTLTTKPGDGHTVVRFRRLGTIPRARGTGETRKSAADSRQERGKKSND
jgi:hypothetical protein